MNGMGWGGNVPEFSRAPRRMENFPTVKEHDRQKGRGEEPRFPVSSARNFTTPKSRIFAVPALSVFSRKMFSGFRSRCRISRLCAASTAAQIPDSMFAALPGDNP